MIALFASAPAHRCFFIIISVCYIFCLFSVILLLFSIFRNELNFSYLFNIKKTQIKSYVRRLLWKHWPSIVIIDFQNVFFFSFSKCLINNVTCYWRAILMKMKLIPVNYQGFTAMDRRFSSPMLPWIVCEIRKRNFNEKVSKNKRRFSVNHNKFLV